MVNACRIVFLTFVLTLTMHSEAKARHGNKVAAALGSAKGIAAVAFTYNMLNGGATWAWGYDWTRNNLTDAITTSHIQEGGGLASAMLTWVVAAFVPLYGALYAEHMKRHQNTQSAGPPGRNRFLGALISPLGVALVSFVYQVLRGTATFVWAYDWTRNNYADDDAKLRIQEAGGLASAGLAWLLGGIIPLYCYLYSEYVSPVDNANLLPVPGHSDPILNWLGTLKGIAAVAFVTSLLDGTATYVWAYNWMRDGHTTEENTRIQEGGAIASAALSWTIASFVPFYLYLYMAHMERARAHNLQANAAAELRAVSIF
jgi:hypothetical protein